MEGIKIKNEGNPIFIGKALCERGTTTMVLKQDYINFCKTPSGRALLNNSVFVIAGDAKKQQRAERDVLRNQVEEEIKIMFEDKLNKLLLDNEEKDKKIVDLERRIEILKETGVEILESVEYEEFKFDPEAHIIEHRGAGKYFIMDVDDKKLYGPLTDEERTLFTEMQKEA